MNPIAAYFTLSLFIFIIGIIIIRIYYKKHKNHNDDDIVNKLNCLAVFSIFWPLFLLFFSILIACVLLYCFASGESFIEFLKGFKK